MKKMRELCGGDESLFIAEVLTPLVINAYNAGARRIGDAAKYYLASLQPDSVLPTGSFSLFNAIKDFAKDCDEGTLDDYGQHASEYVPRIYGHMQALYREGLLS